MPAPGATSLIDRVDDTDEPIGVVARQDIFREQASFRVVHIFVFNQDRDLLLQQVGRNRQRSPLRWGSSVAAYLFAGESYAVAATRRLREELVLDSPLLKLGSTTMHDNGVTKFISLFQTVSGSVSIGERQHIENLEFVSLPEVEHQLAANPERFTETFPYVFRLFQAVAATQ